ncbi:MAG TPA: murein biosynthesis integral membrane protein MurJ, partial [Anaerolinea sp.]|nr:murein biosynthesis integral membrane protein MurJ [Anaerolinea sp.]
MGLSFGNGGIRMKKFSHLTRISALLAFFFALDKGVAFIRQVIIARQFGLSVELDAFNVANNVPDLLYALISGGALAMALIPVLSATLTKEGRRTAWDLFSRIANLVFMATAGMALVVALLAPLMVQSQIGIAPGFGQNQQAVVVELMRLNLIATLIFSISGLVMSGLQANQHFLMPAMAPILYNVGQIFGALVLSPDKGYTIAGVTLPAFGLGVHGLVYGVILGAGLHLAIQVPALLRYQFHWIPSLGLNTAPVRSVLRMLGPRIITVFFIQLIFLIRDNLASRLAAGAVTSLTYGWMLQQVPETLIGTAIGTAMLPTLSALAAQEDNQDFHAAIQRALRVLVGLTIPIAVVMGVALGPLLEAVFGFGAQGTQVLLWTTRGFLAGLLGHSLMEIASRSFYARQDALTPMLTGAVNLVAYILLGLLLYRPLGPAGISL